MSANAAGELPPRARRLLIVAIVAYFALAIYAAVSNSQAALRAANALFGVVVIGIGATLLSQTTSRRSTLAAAGLALIVGGIAQLAWLASGVALFEALSTVAVVTGAVLYVYVIWISR